MEKISLERISACALNRIFGYEPLVSLEFVRSLGSASAVFNLSSQEIDEVLGPFNKHKGLINDGLLESAQKELEMLAGQGCYFLSYTEEGYPEALRECEDAPIGIYIRSEMPPEQVFDSRPAISVVGTRDISPYGKEWCPKLIGAISQAPSKPLIVSGLAFGVDITAHMAAIAYGLPTVAVLPGPINEVYPKAHITAAGKIIHHPHSALVTDYPPGTSPAAHTFLRRNRIIAGLSQATVLVESKVKGGGIMTCRLAQGYGRDVFALPGRIDDIRSGGCNMLLREKVAEPINSLEDVGEQLGLGRYNLRRSEDLTSKLKDIYAALPEGAEKKALLETALLIKKNRGITIEGICDLTEMAYRDVSPIVGRLESDGVISIDLMQRCTINTKIC